MRVYVYECPYLERVYARYKHVRKRDIRGCVHARNSCGIAKAEIRGVYVVASVSAVGPWGQRAA